MENEPKGQNYLLNGPIGQNAPVGPNWPKCPIIESKIGSSLVRLYKNEKIGSNELVKSMLFPTF